MQVRRVITAYLITLALCLIIVAGRTAPGATWTSQESLPPNGTDVALSSPQPGAPTVGPTQGPARPVPLDLRTEDIPFTALTAYRRAASILAQVDPECGLRWTLLAAIGRVESNHGQTVGATLDADGMSRPAVDPVTHGLGPMRFFPSVWEVVAVDGDGDGRRVAEDIDDAALAAAVYLCAETSDLGTRSGMAAAVRGYNGSKRYVDLVLGYEKLYRQDDFLVVASSGEVAPASIVLAGPRLEATPFNRPLPSAKARARIKAEASTTMARAVRPGATAGPASPSPSPSASPAAEPPGEAMGSQTADEPRPGLPPGGDQEAPNEEQPTDGTSDHPAGEQPNDGADAPDPQSPTDPGSPEAPTSPQTSPQQPTSPEDPTSPESPGTAPDACTTVDADPTAEGPTDTGAGDGTGADAGADTGTGKAEQPCPAPDTEPCTAPDKSGTAEPDSGQGGDASADPSSPADGTCQPSQGP